MEVTTIKPVSLEIYSYSDCFLADIPHGKMRPGFKLKNGVWCLTHTQPRGKHLVIKASQINSKHFTCENEVVYLTKAHRSCKRYNSLAGGVITLTAENQKEIGLGNVSPAYCLTLTLNSNLQMTDFKKLLVIEFAALGPIMITDLGTDKISDQEQLKAAYDLCVAAETGNRELSEDEKSRVGTETYNTILPVFQRRQLLSLAPLLHAFEQKGLTEKFVALPVDQLTATLNHASTLTEGNPTIEGSPAELALIEVATATGLDYDLSGYQAATTEETVAAIPEDPQTTAPDNTNEYVAALDEAHQGDAPTVEPAPDAAAETTTAVASTQPVVTNNLPRVAGIANLKSLNDKADAMIAMGTDIKKEVTDNLFNFAEQAATTLDQIEAGDTSNVTTLELAPEVVA